MVYIKNLKISKNVYFSIIYFITSKLGCCHGYFKDIIKSWYLTYLWKINIQYLDFHNAVNQSCVTHIADMWETFCFGGRKTPLFIQSTKCSTTWDSLYMSTIIFSQFFQNAFCTSPHEVFCIYRFCLIFLCYLYILCLQARCVKGSVFIHVLFSSLLFCSFYLHSIV